MKKIISYFLVFLISFFVFNFDVSANELDTNELNLLNNSEKIINEGIDYNEDIELNEDNNWSHKC